MLGSGQPGIVDANAEELRNRTYGRRLLVVESTRLAAANDQRAHCAAVPAADRKADEAADRQVWRQWRVGLCAVEQVALADFFTRLEQRRQDAAAGAVHG